MKYSSCRNVWPRVNESHAPPWVVVVKERCSHSSSSRGSVDERLATLENNRKDKVLGTTLGTVFIG